MDKSRLKPLHAAAPRQRDGVADEGAVRGRAGQRRHAADLDRDASAKTCDFIVVTEIAELKTSKPNKIGGALRKVSGDPNGGGDIHEARVDYKLYAAGEQ